MAPLVLANDTGGRPVSAGDIVHLSNDIAHLYDETRTIDWIVEEAVDNMNWPARAPGPAIQRAGQNPFLRIRNTETGTTVHVPSTWVSRVSRQRPTSPGTPTPPAKDELRELAKVLMDRRNDSDGRVIAGLLAWGCDYVMRTNPPRSDDTPEPLFPSGSMQRVIDCLIRLGELTVATAYSTADVVAAIERLPKRQHDCGVPPAILDVLAKYLLQEAVEAAMPSSRSRADAVATVLDEQFAKAEMHDLLKERLDAVSKALGNT